MTTALPRPPPALFRLFTQDDEDLDEAVADALTEAIAAAPRDERAYAAPVAPGLKAARAEWVLALRFFRWLDRDREALVKMGRQAFSRADALWLVEGFLLIANDAASWFGRGGGGGGGAIHRLTTDDFPELRVEQSWRFARVPVLGFGTHQIATTLELLSWRMVLPGERRTRAWLDAFSLLLHVLRARALMLCTHQPLARDVGATDRFTKQHAAALAPVRWDSLEDERAVSAPVAHSVRSVGARAGTGAEGEEEEEEEARADVAPAFVHECRLYVEEFERQEHAAKWLRLVAGPHVDVRAVCDELYPRVARLGADALKLEFRNWICRVCLTRADELIYARRWPHLKQPTPQEVLLKKNDNMVLEASGRGVAPECCDVSALARAHKRLFADCMLWVFLRQTQGVDVWEALCEREWQDRPALGARTFFFFSHLHARWVLVGRGAAQWTQQPFPCFGSLTEALVYAITHGHLPNEPVRALGASGKPLALIEFRKWLRVSPSLPPPPA